LPGDIRIERENFRFYFPLVTCLLLSLVLSLVLWVIRLLRGQGTLFASQLAWGDYSGGQTDGN
jgi:hypothetical protein